MPSSPEKLRAKKFLLRFCHRKSYCPVQDIVYVSDSAVFLIIDYSIICANSVSYVREKLIVPKRYSMVGQPNKKRLVGKSL